MNTTSSNLRVSLHPTLAGLRFEAVTGASPLTGTLAADLAPLCGALDDREQDLIASASLLVLAGLYLPAVIELDWPSAAAKSTNFHSLLQLLYDIRAYCGQTDFITPKIRWPATGVSPSLPRRAMSLATSGVLQLLSGGIDSTYSLLRLIENGDRPTALFLGLNIDTVSLERHAARTIAERLNVPFLECGFVMEGLPQRNADPKRWPQFGQFPYYNSIPHGRDIVSAAVASIVGARRGIGRLAFGQEKESREKVIEYRGRRILRHDVESQTGAERLNAWLNEQLASPVSLYSPIGDLRIEEIRTNLVEKYPEELSLTQSCVWERLCGSCLKCVSLYVMQRLAGKDFFAFRANPLSDSDNLDLADLVESEYPDNEVGYGEQIRNGIRRIIAEGKYTPDDYWILRASQQDRFTNYLAGKPQPPRRSSYIPSGVGGDEEGNKEGPDP